MTKLNFHILTDDTTNRIDTCLKLASRRRSRLRTKLLHSVIGKRVIVVVKKEHRAAIFPGNIADPAFWNCSETSVTSCYRLFPQDDSLVQIGHSQQPRLFLLAAVSAKSASETPTKSSPDSAAPNYYNISFICAAFCQSFCCKRKKNKFVSDQSRTSVAAPSSANIDYSDWRYRFTYCCYLAPCYVGSLGLAISLVIMVLIVLLYVSFIVSLHKFSVNAYRHCPQTPNAELEKMLGTAYNPRYQSFQLPGQGNQANPNVLKQIVLESDSQEEPGADFSLKVSRKQGKSGGDHTSRKFGDSISQADSYRHPFPDHSAFAGRPDYGRIILNGPFSDLLKLVKSKARRHLATWMEAMRSNFASPSGAAPESATESAISKSHRDRIRHQNRKKLEHAKHEQTLKDGTKSDLLASAKDSSFLPSAQSVTSPVQNISPGTLKPEQTVTDSSLQSEDPTRYKFEDDLSRAEKAAKLERIQYTTAKKLKTAFLGYSKERRKEWLSHQKKQRQRRSDLSFDSSLAAERRLQGHEMDNYNDTGLSSHPRDKRSALPPWGCQSKIEWVDLGPDHFPRFVRNLTCIANPCWFKRGSCRGKGFYIKVLHRMADKCIEVSPEDFSKFGISADEVHVEQDTNAPKFREPWVWKEITITFCCECVLL